MSQIAEVAVYWIQHTFSQCRQGSVESRGSRAGAQYLHCLAPQVEVCTSSQYHDSTAVFIKDTAACAVQRIRLQYARQTILLQGRPGQSCHHSALSRLSHTLASFPSVKRQVFCVGDRLGMVKRKATATTIFAPKSVECLHTLCAIVPTPFPPISTIAARGRSFRTAISCSSITTSLLQLHGSSCS